MTRRGWRILGWSLLAIVLVIAVGFAVLRMAGTPAGELVELVEQGPVTELEAPRASDDGGARVLVFAIDGVGEDAFRETVHGGDMPHVQGLFGEDEGDGLYDNGWIVPNALSILPSTTMAAWTSTFTGEPVGQHGVSGNEWFERETATFHAPAPVSVQGHADTLKMLNDGLVGNSSKAPTVFERLEGRSHVSLLPVYRGADLYTIPDPPALASLFESVTSGITGDESVSQETYRKVDQEAIESLAAGIEQHGIPTLQVVYYPGIDLHTHIANDPLESQRNYLRDVVDPGVGRVLDLYRERDALEDTWVVFLSDHGHTPVLNDDVHSLSVGEPDEPSAVLESTGFRVRPFSLEVDEEDYQAVLAYQGAIAYVYLADRSTCEADGARCDWTAAPRFEEDVLPVARAFHAANRGKGAEGALEGALDLVFTRPPRPPDQEALPYQVFDGESLIPISRWLSENPRPDLLALAPRMRDLSAGPWGHRAGDVLLLSKSGDHRPIEERYYFSGPYRSWHGSPSPSDSRITFAVAHAERDGDDVREGVRELVGRQPSQLDVARLLLALASTPR